MIPMLSGYVETPGWQRDRYRRDFPRTPAALTVRRLPGLATTVLCAGIILASLAAGACGYKVTGAVKQMPAGIHSLGIPPFRNLSPTYRIEQRLTAGVLKEFSIRTRGVVRPVAAGVDAVLIGEVRTVSSSPVTFGADTFGSAFVVTVQVSAKLVRTSDAKVLWENPDFLFRERYVLNGKVSDFFSEEGPALDRLARDFAASLASTVLNSRTP